MIRTDGVSSCSLFIRTYINKNPVNKTIKKISEEHNTDYIEKVELTEELKK